MKKTLVLYARVCPTKSFHTQQIFEAFQKQTNFVCVNLDANQPFDVLKEQEFILGFDRIILLFTLNWYNIPWSLSRYFIEVWRTFPFSLENKEVYKIITTGANQDFYEKKDPNINNISVEEYLNNVNGMLKKLRASIQKSFYYYGAINQDQMRLNRFVNELIKYFKNQN